MRKRALVLLVALTAVTACAETRTRTIVDVPTNSIYVKPGPVAINGGVSAPNAYVGPDHPFVTDYVLKRPTASDYADINLAVGGHIRDGIRLHPVPGTGYAYAMINGRTVLADANRQRIVKIYD